MSLQEYQRNEGGRGRLHQQPCLAAPLLGRVFPLPTRHADVVVTLTLGHAQGDIALPPTHRAYHRHQWDTAGPLGLALSPPEASVVGVSLLLGFQPLAVSFPAHLPPQSVPLFTAATPEGLPALLDGHLGASRLQLLLDLGGLLLVHALHHRLGGSLH